MLSFSSCVITMLTSLLFYAGRRPLELGGILLTHAHTGHYTGLLRLGKEGADMRGVPVSGERFRFVGGDCFVVVFYEEDNSHKKLW